jgi:hypothetical protein
MLIALCIKEFKQGEMTFIGGVCLLVGIITTLLLGIYSFITMYKLAPIIIIDASSIRFKYTNKEEIYNIKDIDIIGYTGKRPYKYIITHGMEGVAIQFKDGTIKYIYDDLYSNTSEMKLYLQQLVDGITYNGIAESAITDIGNVKYYKGVSILSMRGIAALFFFLLFIVTLFNDKIINGNIKDVSFGIVFAIPFAGMFMLFSYMLNYIGVSDNYLIIRNHHLPWVKKIYRLDNIKEVVFDTQPKSPNILRIITKDFKNKMYPASSLSDKKWLELEHNLEAKGIKVRNELL